jgi:HSP20 family protein
VPATRVLATFDDLLDDFRRGFRESIWTPWEWAIKTYLPYEVEFPVRAAYSDLIDEGNKFLVRAEVPGIPRNKLDVTVTKSGIEISGEASAKSEEKDKNYVVRERSYSSIYKNLEFPEEVIPEKAECTVKDGVLEVSIPKRTPTPEAKKHKVAVKEAK